MHSFEALAEHGAGAMEAGFHDAGIDIEDVSGGFGGEVFEVAEHEDGAVFVGEIVDEAGQKAAEFAVVDGFVGGLDAGGDEVLPLAGYGFEGEVGTRGKAGTAAAGEAGVAGDAEDPGFDVFGFAELVEVFADFEDGFLGDFFGFLAAAAIEIAVLEDCAEKGGQEGIASAVAPRDHIACQEL